MFVGLAVVVASNEQAVAPDGMIDARVCAPTVCGPMSCGTAVDACGNETECNLCRYSGETVLEEDVALGMGYGLRIGSTSPPRISFDRTLESPLGLS